CAHQLNQGWQDKRFEVYGSFVATYRSFIHHINAPRDLAAAANDVEELRRVAGDISVISSLSVAVYADMVIASLDKLIRQLHSPDLTEEEENDLRLEAAERYIRFSKEAR